ncbi:type III pantothenate kinase [Marinihelvus fidelis]|uniref:Type III pantothenate kinase n=1 Tax=Marinihelvus fidelis TaxID=2613842 RepID=A0A5N0TC97_9GAMM|nr:type III pantothenate kinase [Marinihelvus fidelis]KAA9132044.1 type III pantothenate kinase [Marinihelvus fidelis]
MILCLDVGNSHIYGGLFEGDQLRLTFRRTSSGRSSSDELGLFFRSVLRENGFDPDAITNVALCSVVPELVYSIAGSMQKYFGVRPFILKAGVKTGLKILYRNPVEVGSDRIANAIAGTGMFPDENLLIIDLGTATTVDAISAERDYLGGAIIPGLRLSMQALDQGTARLSSVEIIRPDKCLGRTTAASIQSGLYFGHLGALSTICAHLTAEMFDGKKPRVIATGGFASLFAEAGLYDNQAPDLVLRGLLMALVMNLPASH